MKLLPRVSVGDTADLIAAFQLFVTKQQVTDPLILKYVEFALLATKPVYFDCSLYMMSTSDLCGGAANIGLVHHGLLTHRLSECTVAVVLSFILCHSGALPLNRKVVSHIESITVNGRAYVLGLVNGS